MQVRNTDGRRAPPDNQILLFNKVLELLELRLARFVLALQLLDHAERVVEAHGAARFVDELLDEHAPRRLHNGQVGLNICEECILLPPPVELAHHGRCHVGLGHKVDTQHSKLIFVCFADVFDVRNVVGHRHAINWQDDRLLLFS